MARAEAWAVAMAAMAEAAREAEAARAAEVLQEARAGVEVSNRAFLVLV